jgi:hypothetical protein
MMRRSPERVSRTHCSVPTPSSAQAACSCSAGQYNVFLPLLEQPETFRFLTLEAAKAGEHSYLPFDSMIDHVLVTTDALTEYGAGQTDILELEQSISGYQANVSDHRPVLVDFAAP